MEYEMRIVQVPVTTLAAFMEACAAHPSDDPEALASFAGFSGATAKRALPSLETLGVIARDGDGVYRIKAEGVGRGMSHEAAASVIRRALQGFRPFEMLCEGLALGEDAATAIRKTALLLGLDDRAADRLEILLRWGADLGILAYSERGVQLVAELAESAVGPPPVASVGDLESEAKARLYNGRSLGREANNYLDETDRQLLADALLRYEKDPRQSVEDSGQAFEDFLREVAADKALTAEAGKASGIGQLANVLYSKGAIHNHHQKLADAIGSVRNATAHRKDKKSLTPWAVTPLGAFSVHSMTLTAIASIHAYTTKGAQTL